MIEINFDEHWTMKDLIDTRNRYQRMLNALGYTSRTDHNLRAELIETIEHFDRKIGQMSSTNRTIPPGGAVSAGFRCTG
jgi:alcohol dehydrogenase class IV